MSATEPPEEPSSGTGTGDPGPVHAATPAPTRRPIMWLALVGVLAAIAVAVLVGPLEACLVLAGLLAVLAVVRLAARSPGPYGVSTRSRGFDVVVLLVAALVIGALAVTVRENM